MKPLSLLPRTVLLAAAALVVAPLVGQPASPNIDCSLLRSGRYVYEQRPGQMIIIERNDREQTSHRLYRRYFKRQSIEWIGPCRYRLRTIEVNDPLLSMERESETIAEVFLISDRFYEYREAVAGQTGATVRVFFLSDLAAMVSAQEQILRLMSQAEENGDPFVVQTNQTAP